jgi:ATP-dependent 26S proteasome regulatory subunit
MDKLNDAQNGGVMVIASSSQTDKVDKSIRRGGRVDLDIRLDMPSDADRFMIFKE